MMKMKTIRGLSKAFIVFSALALCSVSLTAFYDPQLIMDPVKVKLSNNDAYSIALTLYLACKRKTPMDQPLIKH
jgi:hypothetical protein